MVCAAYHPISYAKINISVSGKSQENPILKLGPNPIGQALYFFGARHTNDPTNAQFIYLKQCLYEFLNVAKEKKIIFVEGAIREIPKNYEEATRQYGEAGTAQWLAKEADIDVICPEPTDEEQRKVLCVSFSPQVVAYTMIVQHLAVWFRQIRQLSFGEAVSRSVKRETKFAEIYGFTPDDDWFYGQHKKLFGDQQVEDKNFLNSISDPRRDDTLINKVVAYRSNLRNKYILLMIKEAWKSGKSIFIVYGKGHLATLENQLRELTMVVG